MKKDRTKITHTMTDKGLEELPIPNWEEEFDKEFRANKIPRKDVVFDTTKMKSFIRQLLAQQKKELIGKIKNCQLGCLIQLLFIWNNNPVNTGVIVEW